MKLILKISLACLLATGCASKISAQTYVKLNGLYALVGVVNPAVEFTLSPKSTFQTEIVVSPWKSINNHHALFCIFMGEYRRYFKEHNRGWYLGANIGMQAFDLSKPYIENWKLKFENRYSKGYGFMIGLCVGYEHIFRERWVLDAYLGWSWMSSFYNGYSMDGKIDMDRRSGIPTRSDCRSDTVFSIHTRKNSSATTRPASALPNRFESPAARTSLPYRHFSTVSVIFPGKFWRGGELLIFAAETHSPGNTSTFPQERFRTKYKPQANIPKQ